MNVRSLAEDGATRYLDNIDQYQPHSKNISSYLRPLITNLTKRVLLDDATTLQEESLMEPSVDGSESEGATTDDEKSTHRRRRVMKGISKRSIARMDAFLHNCILAIPDEAMVHKSLSSSLHAMQQNKNYYPQFVLPDLAVRLEIYLRSLKRVRDYNYENPKEEDTNPKTYAFNLENKFECLVALEPQRVLQARTDALVRSFVATANNVSSIRPLLTALILGLTLEILAVDVLGKEIKKKINRLVSEYEHLTSFASLTFLSSPEEAADSHLVNLILSYLSYLQTTYKSHESSSELESMLTNVLPADLRKTYQTVEFRSVGHLLEVCDSYKKVLQNINLPPVRNYEALMAKCSNPKDVKQALKDLRREIITVNGTVIPPAHNLKELVRLLAETMNARTTTLYNDSHGDEGAHGRRVEANVVRIESDTDDDDQNKEGTVSGNEGDSEETGRHRARVRSNSKGGGRKRSFDGATVDKMTARLLIAAGRSGTGADAYFVIQDLFGGEGVIVVPSRSQAKRPSSKLPRSRKRSQIGTIDIVVKLTSITIKVHAHYDVYPERSISDDGVEPLIQLYSTTTETIHLHEVRVRQSGFSEGAKGADVELNEKMETSILMLKEKKTANTGKRILSIRPASYKKVEVRNTFS